MAWLADGRSGLIVGGNFNADAGEWLWAIDTLGGPFRESDLFHSDPTDITEDRAERIEFDPSGLVTQDELFEAIDNVRQFVRDNAGLSEPQVRAIAEDARDQAVTIANLNTFGVTETLRVDLENSIGTVAPGKLADLIVVDGDPLADIALLQGKERIRWVMKEGKVFLDRVSSV